MPTQTLQIASHPEHAFWLHVVFLNLFTKEENADGGIKTKEDYAHFVDLSQISLVLEVYSLICRAQIASGKFLLDFVQRGH